ncbi:MAG: SIMPL domain-containing protein [Acidimicrobiia bacterium]|nr:SIMPL domain-containing protein [Acidimicrobiia bacterium]
MVQIRVAGSGQASSAPDEAAFQFRCQGFAPDASESLSQATLAAEAVLGLLDELGVPPELRGLQRARVHPRTRWDGDREVRDGWDARATVECTLSDATAAFELLEQATTIDRVSIHGPEWQVRPSNPAHDAARQLAVADGRMKAESYANAAGLTLGDLQELVEGGAQHGSPMMRSMGASEATSLEASDQIVHASVTLVFEAT